ncbi:MAG: T9SS type A sorting domain-containing protein [Sphingobacteriales bacterium]|nr:T9SS type A sorting domain-containing protein [Sphingobacteriales bacterium]
MKKKQFIVSSMVFMAAAAYSAAPSVLGIIDVNALDNYSNQNIPAYIAKDNTPAANPITDAGATLGRVLFYDPQLSVNNTVSCGSCHKQEFAFSDTVLVNTGVNGVTARHPMRLVNARFANEVKFFWDERVNSLEQQTTSPIQDHAEMGFSGANGDPNLDSLINKLEDIDYYQDLFTLVYGDPQITELRMQRAMAQFVRSIQSFDSKYDAGLAATGNIGAPFPNFTAQENQGKQLFLTPPPNGGAGCQACHAAPEFDIDPNSLNNNIIGVANYPDSIDLTVTRAPSLRDLVNPAGIVNGSFMHNGSLPTLQAVINHYNTIVYNPAINTNLDPRLIGPPPPPGGSPGLHLNLTQAQKDALAAFLLTLSGSDVYTNPKWSDPFVNGELVVSNFCPDNIAFNYEDIGSGVFEVANTISAHGSVDSGSNSTFSAADFIALLPNFIAAYGSQFIAEIGGCNSNAAAAPTSQNTAIAESAKNTLVADTQNMPQLTLFPNPSQGNFVLQCQGALQQVQVFTIEGKWVRSYQNIQQTQLNMEGLEKGMYIIKATDVFQNSHTVKCLVL